MFALSKTVISRKWFANHTRDSTITAGQAISSMSNPAVLEPCDSAEAFSVSLYNVVPALFLSSVWTERTPVITNGANEVPEAISLLGVPLITSASIAEQDITALERDLASASSEAQETPEDPEKLIVHGLKLAALSRFGEAIKVFNEGIQR